MTEETRCIDCRYECDPPNMPAWSGKVCLWFKPRKMPPPPVEVDGDREAFTVTCPECKTRFHCATGDYIAKAWGLKK